ncbi:glycosyltransferase family 4 protein [Sulfuricystis multivorans]|uniref:glycosyltransferase family 4 protein n=1 Tax=Sulfuricystis multivorans TaxID=2211108 RepID=UPI0015584579|nr:glycosyltransferase family 4 protein [Sulfuricystis multivorans]
MTHNLAQEAGGSLRVLHTEWSMGWGGQEIRIIAEMKAFRELGVPMEIACREGSRIGQEASKAGIGVHYLPFATRVDPVTILGLRRIVRNGGFSLIHTHSSIDSWCGGLTGRFFGIPVVRSRHLSSLVHPGFNARLVYDWLPDAVISSGRHIRDHLVEVCGCHGTKHFSIPAGADPQRFSPDADGMSVRNEFGLGDATVVGIVAVLRSWKGHRVLFEACARSLAAIPDLRLLVVGDGPLREHLPQWAAELGLAERVRFAGHREDIPNCMKAMDVCVLPSLKNEATSQVMPQAMLVGTPVVCSAAGGLTEVVQDGITGRVVPPGDVDALARALQDCFAKPEQTAEMARHAREYALAHLTFAQQIQKTLDVYRFVAAKRLS